MNFIHHIDEWNQFDVVGGWDLCFVVTANRTDSALTKYIMPMPKVEKIRVLVTALKLYSDTGAGS